MNKGCCNLKESYGSNGLEKRAFASYSFGTYISMVVHSKSNKLNME